MTTLQMHLLSTFHFTLHRSCIAASGSWYLDICFISAPIYFQCSYQYYISVYICFVFVFCFLTCVWRPLYPCLTLSTKQPVFESFCSLGVKFFGSSVMRMGCSICIQEWHILLLDLFKNVAPKVILVFWAMAFCWRIYVYHFSIKYFLLAFKLSKGSVEELCVLRRVLMP